LYSENWGGLFADPDLNPRAFSLLPEERQQEIIHNKRLHAALGRWPTREEVRLAMDASKRVTLRVHNEQT